MVEKTDILSIFMESPERQFHIREVAKLRKVSPMSARKYLMLLSKEGLVISKRERNVVLFRANESSLFFKEYKKWYNIMKIMQSGLLEFLDLELSYPTVILFGSFARGEDSSKSDVDLFVLSNTKKELNMSKYEENIGRKVQLFCFNDKQFRDLMKKNPQLINNIINGTKLRGFLKVL